MNTLKKYLKRYFVDSLSAMALGLFASLIIGLILSQLAQISFLSFLTEFSDVAKSNYVVGGAIGAAIAYGLKAKPLVIFSCITTGAYGYQMGGPVGAFIGGLVGCEIGSLVAGKTKIDIVVSPIVTIVAGGAAAYFMGSPISSFMTGLGSIINTATTLSPVPMGIIVAVIVGLALTAPISSAALCIMLDLSGLAAGAAVVGCCAQMVGFAVTSYKDNGFGGLISQGLGTSMLQIGNIFKNPAILIAPTLTAAILGPISTTVFKMTNTAVGAGMGTSGLVGQFGALSAMGSDFMTVVLPIILMHFILPAAISLLIHKFLNKKGIVKDGDMKLTLQ